MGRVRRIFGECASGVGGEASARSRVATLATIFRGLDDAGKRAFLALLATYVNGDEASTAPLVDAYVESGGVARQLAALRLRAALAGTALFALGGLFYVRRLPKGKEPELGAEEPEEPQPAAA